MASEKEVKHNKMALGEQKLNASEKDSVTASSACTLSQPQSYVEYEPGNAPCTLSHALRVQMIYLESVVQFWTNHFSFCWCF